jgi:hypothetical protein
MIPKKVIEKINGYRITVNDKTKVTEYSLGDVFSVNQDDLVNEFAQQAATYAYFASLQVQADNNSDVCKLGMEQERASADESVRANFEKDGKKYTEAVVKSQVDLDTEVAKLAEARLGFEYDAKLLKAICNALEMRAQMLISIGNQLRHEIEQGNMSIRERQMNKAVADLDNVLKEKRSK